MALETKPLGPVGVEVLGVDLLAPLPDETLGALRALAMDEGLLLFRDQPIEPEDQVLLGRRFGEIEQLDLDADGGEARHIVIGNVDRNGQTLPDDDPRMKLITINEGWHTDSSFREVPASFSIFACVIAPEQGGDTFWASLERGWEALEPEEQARLYGARAVHDYTAAYRRRGNEMGRIVGFDMSTVTHPLVRRHPETGRTGLYVSEHVARVEGLPEPESRALLDRLLAVCTREDRVYRHHWRVGDVAIWDNRCMLHRAQGFDARQPRVMHHVRIAGNEPPIAARA